MSDTATVQLTATEISTICAALNEVILLDPSAATAEKALFLRLNGELGKQIVSPQLQAAIEDLKH